MQQSGGAEAPDEAITVQMVTGDPLVSRATDIYRQMLTDAGVEGADSAEPPQGRRPWLTTFHVAVDGRGTALGVLHATVGPLERLRIARLVDPDERLADPVCECPSIAVEPSASGRGVTELLFRSVYCFARRQGARSLAMAIEPLILDVLRDGYGIMLRPLGEVTSYMGVEAVAAGEELEVLEEAVQRLQPAFASFLMEPFSPAERTRFGLPDQA